MTKEIKNKKGFLKLTQIQMARSPVQFNTRTAPMQNWEGDEIKVNVLYLSFDPVFMITILQLNTPYCKKLNFQLYLYLCQVGRRD